MEPLAGDLLLYHKQVERCSSQSDLVAADPREDRSQTGSQILEIRIG